ncbi:MAG: hypothetical protein EOO24_18780 [Comamonadaceae bacterium]|nr:MAG: hypothetical protein EOO24_18780 [Comamonadaceae bacterium]
MITRRHMLALPAALYAANAATAASATSAASAGIPADAAPALDDMQLGHLQYIANVARRRHNDWTGMDSEEPGQGGFDAYRYQLAMMAYTVHLANYHYTPAWRDGPQATSEKLIEKMMRFDVWSFWEMTSRGAKQFDPSLAALSEGWRDPVIRQNIMYSGHLFHMVTAYGMLYDSARYEQPGALTFIYNPTGRGLGKEEYPYDTLKLAEVLRQQFDANGYAGIECEPNAIFVECNQHPILGFRMLDHRRGSSYYPEVSGRYLKVFEEQQFFDPKNGSSMFFKMIKQDRKVPAQMPWNDGWAGTFMHGWAPEKVAQVYPLLKGKYVVRQADGSAVIPFQKPGPFWSWDNGFFAALAAEVGDVETSRSMLAYADRHWSPTWEQGGLNYPRNDAFDDGSGRGNGIAQRFSSPRVNTLTGNGLLGLARINPGRGLLGMVQRPWTAEHFRQPHITDVSPQTQVAQAVFDPAAQALNLRFKPRRGAGASRTSLNVRNLQAGAAYAVMLNGSAVARLSGNAAQSTVSAVAAQWRDGALSLTLPQRGDTTVVVRRTA